MSSLVKPHNWSFLRKQESRKIKEKTGFPLKNCGNDGNISNVLLLMNSLVTEKVVTSRCPGGITFNKKRNFGKIKDNFSITIPAIKKLFEEFLRKTEFFQLTGCFHSAALSDGKRILAFAEDIGRHNTVDKIIGYSIIEDIPFTGKLMLVSCRISSEIISKCSRWGIPIIASRAAPTDLASEIAEKSGITLAGFVRGDSLNVYSNAQRII